VRAEAKCCGGAVRNKNAAIALLLQKQAHQFGLAGHAGLVKIFDKWLRAVPTVMPSRSAVARLASPLMISIAVSAGAADSKISRNIPGRLKNKKYRRLEFFRSLTDQVIGSLKLRPAGYERPIKNNTLHWVAPRKFAVRPLRTALRDVSAPALAK
jgi:hypothetical protein